MPSGSTRGLLDTALVKVLVFDTVRMEVGDDLPTTGEAKRATGDALRTNLISVELCLGVAGVRGLPLELDGVDTFFNSNSKDCRAFHMLVAASTFRP